MRRAENTSAGGFESYQQAMHKVCGYMPAAQAGARNGQRPAGRRCARADAWEVQTSLPAGSAPVAAVTLSRRAAPRARASGPRSAAARPGMAAPVWRPLRPPPGPAACATHARFCSTVRCCAARHGGARVASVAADSLPCRMRHAREPVLMSAAVAMSAAARPGMAAPVWLTSAAVTPAGECVHDLALAFAGIVSLGVADSAASAVGRRFGRHRILGTRKTIEGTLGGIALTLAAWAVIWPLCRCGATAAGHVGILAQARTAQPVRTLRGSLRARAPAGCLHDALSTLARMRLKQAGGWRPARQLATIVSAWDIMTIRAAHASWPAESALAHKAASLCLARRRAAWRCGRSCLRPWRHACWRRRPRSWTTSSCRCTTWPCWPRRRRG